MSNAIMIRDASDLTTYKKKVMIAKSYKLLVLGKNYKPLGGIPQSDRMAIGFVDIPVIPTNSLLANVTGPADCPTCFNNVEYFTTQVVNANKVIEGPCPNNLVCDGVYQPDLYQKAQNPNV